MLKRVRWWWLSAMVAATIPGCVAAPGSSVVPSPGGIDSPSVAIPDDTPSLGPSEPRCFGINESIYAPEPTLENLRPYSGDVVVATVVEIEPGFFNTIDGKRPPVASGLGPGTIPASLHHV